MRGINVSAVGRRVMRFTQKSKSRRAVAGAVVLVLAIGLVPQSRHAIEGALHIHGQLTGSSCNTGSGGATFTRNTMAVAPTPDGNGYWLMRDDGGIFPYGDATQGLGSAGASPIQTQTTAFAATRSGLGYWLVERRGMVWAYGDAQCFGGTYDTGANDIVGIAPTASGLGYWLLEQDGGIWPYGDAVNHTYGGLGNHVPLLTDIVGMAASPTGNGYWIAEANGGVFSFGDASGCCGSMGNVTLNAPISAIITPPGGGQGYTLIGRDGGTFNFGFAKFPGSLVGQVSVNDVVGGGWTLLGHGAWLARGNGQVLGLGDAGSYQ